MIGVSPASGFEEQEVLLLAASLERGSEHPLAAAIVSGAEQRGVKPTAAENFESVTGKGVRATVSGRSVALGNRKLMEDTNVNLETLAQTAETLRADGQTVM